MVQFECPQGHRPLGFHLPDKKIPRKVIVGPCTRNFSCVSEKCFLAATSPSLEPQFSASSSPSMIVAVIYMNRIPIGREKRTPRSLTPQNDFGQKKRQRDCEMRLLFEAGYLNDHLAS